MKKVVRIELESARESEGVRMRMGIKKSQREDKKKSNKDRDEGNKETRERVAFNE